MIQVSSAVVVVLPWVPVTTRFGGRAKNNSSALPATKGKGAFYLKRLPPPDSHASSRCRSPPRLNRQGYFPRNTRFLTRCPFHEEKSTSADTHFRPIL